MKWMIENFTGDNGYDELIAEVRKQGMECVVLDITNYFEVKPEMTNEGECVMFQGSIQLFHKLKSELNVYPLGWMTDENYLCSKYYGRFPSLLFNDKHVFSTVGGLKHNKWFFYSTFGKEALIYIRPDGGDKKFTGQLIDLQDFDAFMAEGVGIKSKYGGCDVKDDDMVVISTPKNVVGEWRFICHRNEIIAVSTYMFQKQRTYIPTAPVNATKKCEEVLSVGYYPDPVFTVDICEDDDGDFWLLELNSFTTAGTYGADKSKIVKRVSEIALEEYEKNRSI